METLDLRRNAMNPDAVEGGESERSLSERTRKVQEELAQTEDQYCRKASDW